MFRTILIIFPVLFSLTGSFPAAQQTFEFPVEHQHLFRNCRGTLFISAEELTFRTDHRQDARRWAYPEIRSIRLVAPAVIEIHTYEDQRRMLGRDRIFRFRLLAGEIPVEAATLLAARSAHPLVTNLDPAAVDTPLYTIPVKHRHRLGGCDGTLSVFTGRVSFVSADVPADSRSWRFADLEGFAHIERFRLEFITLESSWGSDYRTYEFELKCGIPEAAVDFIRQQLAASRRQ